MKTHMGLQGQTLAEIYELYYEKVDLSEEWGEGFNRFLLFNEHVWRISPYKLQGGEMVILPDSPETDGSTNVVTLEDVADEN